MTIAFYIHWPFCRSKCPYCDFNSHVRDTIDQQAWRTALLQELNHYAELIPHHRTSSIFFGGGTPSLMPPSLVAAIIERIAAQWPLTENCEITLEANPTSTEADNFAALAKAGVNRLSLGIQSLDNDVLKFLGREHDAAAAQRAIETAARFFPRYSFDLIYATAGQSLQIWERALRAALPLVRGHMSLYQLTIEPATLFFTRHARGEILAAPDELAATMYEMTQAIMEEAGLPSYEISNHAAPGQESRHNLTYWRYDDFIGIGPGAHGRYQDAHGIRYATAGHKTPEAWLGHVHAQGHGVREREAIDQMTAQREAVMMGLRLRTGIDRRAWHEKFGMDALDFLDSEKITRLQDEGLLHSHEHSLSVTPRGALRLNAVLRHLLGTR